jgi:hypothetical protein
LLSPIKRSTNKRSHDEPVKSMWPSISAAPARPVEIRDVLCT